MRDIIEVHRTRGIGSGIHRLLVLASIFLAACTNQDTSSSLVSVGHVPDFPTGSVTFMELPVVFHDPDPPATVTANFGITQLPEAAVSPVSIFLVHDTTEGFLAIYARDPHLGCQVHWKEESQWFEDPCYGARYTLTGVCIGGPCERGLDRFDVVVTEDGEVRVDIGEYSTGPALTPE